MSVKSYRTGSSLFRNATNNNIFGTNFSARRQKHLWICSQIHCRTIFLVMQILLIILASLEFCWGIQQQQLHWIFFAYGSFVGAIAGIWALRLADSIYKYGCRVTEHCAIPPQLIIIPSYIVQIGYVILLAYLSFLHLTYNIALFDSQPLIIVIFGNVIPISFIWLMILYIFAAEIDCYVYVIRRSRHWRLRQHPPTLLNIRAFNSDRYNMIESASRKHIPGMNNTLPGHEQTKSLVSGGSHDSASKKSCNDGTETRIEVIPHKYAVDEVTPFFSEFINHSRKGTSMIASQLDTVPEESSKSTTSYQ